MEQVMEESRGEKFQGTRNRILVQSLNSLRSTREVKDYSIEYHMVDLEHDNIYYHCFPSLFSVAGPSSLVVSGDTVYTFGSMPPSTCTVESDPFKQLQPQSPLTKMKYFLGSCGLKMNSDTQLWFPVPFPLRTFPSFRCITLLGKIYAFGFASLEPEVLDPKFGHWIPLSVPSELDGCDVSFFALPDPSNNRIILHLSGSQLPSPSVYAFSPHASASPSSSAGTWKCLASDFAVWSRVAVVIDNILFLHTNKYVGLLRAFDLAAGTWLEVIWAERFDDNVDMNTTTLGYDALLPLGDDLLCLAYWEDNRNSDDSVESPMQITTSFRKFRVMRDGPTINLFPISSHSYLLPATCRVFKFAPV